MSENFPNKTRVDEQAWADFMQSYAPRITALAESRLNRKLRRRVEAEDILQSVLRSFFVRYEPHQIEEQSPTALWQLLVTMTLNKIRKQFQKQQALKRSINKEDTIDLSEIPNFTQIDASTTIAICDELAWLMKQLTVTQRDCLERRLQGQTIPEISLALECSEKTIHRWLQSAFELLTYRSKLGATRVAVTPISTNELVWPDHLPRCNPRNYHLQKLIGQGSTSKVYRALRLTDQRTVCLKVLRLPLINEQRYQQQLLNEASVLYEQRIKGVVPILGIGQMPRGAIFLEFEWIPGQALSTWLRTDTANKNQRTLLIEQLQKILDTLHQMNITHGDIHAGNILIDDQHQPWLLDFGVSQKISGEENLPAAVEADLQQFAELRQFINSTAM
jgi:RNA polymerase sigma factor (sigma-70 family)